eukprot:scaffold1282_cov251-Pinguiococcus_pyrenoidosus.AAC.20
MNPLVHNFAIVYLGASLRKPVAFRQALGVSQLEGGQFQVGLGLLHGLVQAIESLLGLRVNLLYLRFLKLLRFPQRLRRVRLDSVESCFDLLQLFAQLLHLAINLCCLDRARLPTFLNCVAEGAVLSLDLGVGRLFSSFGSVEGGLCLDDCRFGAPLPRHSRLYGAYCFGFSSGPLGRRIAGGVDLLRRMGSDTRPLCLEALLLKTLYLKRPRLELVDLRLDPAVAFTLQPLLLLRGNGRSFCEQLLLDLLLPDLLLNLQLPILGGKRRRALSLQHGELLGMALPQALRPPLLLAPLGRELDRVLRLAPLEPLLLPLCLHRQLLQHVLPKGLADFVTGLFQCPQLPSVALLLLPLRQLPRLLAVSANLHAELVSPPLRLCLQVPQLLAMPRLQLFDLDLMLPHQSI